MAMPTLMELLKRSADYLIGRGIANGRRESEWIFAETLGLSRLQLYTGFDMPLEDATVQRLRELVQRRGKREPLAYVLGNQEFCGLRLAVGPEVLVPRPETEELVEHALKELPPTPARIVDIGTGSGAIALAIASKRPDCQVEGSDVSEDALRIARQNADRLQASVAWTRGHLGEHLSGPYDLIVANLPYIGESEKPDCDPEISFEPRHALFAEREGMALIEALLADAPRLLARNGVIWLEHGWKQSLAVLVAAERSGLKATAHLDLAGHPRFCRASRG